MLRHAEAMLTLYIIHAEVCQEVRLQAHIVGNHIPS